MLQRSFKSLFYAGSGTHLLVSADSSLQKTGERSLFSWFPEERECDCRAQHAVVACTVCILHALQLRAQGQEDPFSSWESAGVQQRCLQHGWEKGSSKIQVTELHPEVSFLGSWCAGS